jgi:hypothetical protein
MEMVAPEMAVPAVPAVAMAVINRPRLIPDTSTPILAVKSSMLGVPWRVREEWSFSQASFLMERSWDFQLALRSKLRAES